MDVSVGVVDGVVLAVCVASAVAVAVGGTAMVAVAVAVEVTEREGVALGGGGAGVLLGASDGCGVAEGAIVFVGATVCVAVATAAAVGVGVGESEFESEPQPPAKLASSTQRTARLRLDRGPPDKVARIETFLAGTGCRAGRRGERSGSSDVWRGTLGVPQGRVKEFCGIGPNAPSIGRDGRREAAEGIGGLGCEGRIESEEGAP